MQTMVKSCKLNTTAKQQLNYIAKPIGNVKYLEKYDSNISEIYHHEESLRSKLELIETCIRKKSTNEGI